MNAKSKRWRCLRCCQEVDMKAKRCGCTESPSPWEPIPEPVKKPWAFTVGPLRIVKPLYARPRWGFLVQNVPDYAEEFGLVTPLFCIAWRGPAAKWFYLVLPLGVYREEITLL